MPTLLRKKMISEQFHRYYRAKPQFWSRAPGRVDLMGSHTDYNNGYVMTMTIDQDTWIAARFRSDRKVQIRSLNIPGCAEFDLDKICHSSDTDWTDYVRGVAWALSDAGYHLTGFDGLIHSTVPFGSGLSSSAAIEMAAGVAFQQTGGFSLDPLEMALLGQKAENLFVGMNCGILDQYSSALGQQSSALLLDCRSLTSNIIPIAPEIRIMICNTKAERNLRGTEYRERRSQCELGVKILSQSDPGISSLRDVSMVLLIQHRQELPEVVYRRCRFILEENQRVLDLAEPLTNCNRDKLRSLFQASYEGARDLYEIGAPSMEAMIEATTSAPGVIAARQAGAGFGGCMVALVEGGSESAFIQHVSEDYKKHTNISPEIYEVHASPGAGPI